MQPSLSRHLALLALLIAGGAAGLRHGPATELAGFVLGALALALAIWLTLAYLSALRALHDAAPIRPGSLWRPVFAGHWGRAGLGVFAALGGGASLALAAVAEPLWLIAMAAAAALAIWPAARFFGARLAEVVTPEQLPRFALRPAIWCAAAAALAIALIQRAVAAPEGDLAAMIAGAPRYEGSSLILREAVDAFALWSGLGDTLAGLGGPGIIAAVALDAGLALAIAMAMAATLIPPGGFARILRPGAAPGPGTWLMAGFALCLIPLLALQSAAGFEARARLFAIPPSMMTAAPELGDAGGGASPAIAGAAPDPRGWSSPPPLPSDLRRAIERERIGDLICPPGTLARLDGLEAEVSAIYAAQSDRLRQQAEAGFDRLRANVPAFLDWYYSLTAEYLRTLNLLIGNGEAYLSGRMDGILGAGEPFTAVNAGLAALRETSAPVVARLRAAENGILADCGIALPQDGAEIVLTATRAIADLRLPALIDSAVFETRARNAGLAGLGAGIGVAILGKVGAKVVVSSAFKAAAAALAKIAGGKAITFLGGVGAGAVVGAAGGSVAPGAGTTAGALIGGVAGGAAVMLGVDFTLLKLEEVVAREDFQAEILAAIDAAEAEVLPLFDPGH